ncbi:small ribosomal subunit protein mS78 (rPPR3a)-like [Coffea arabica]|uniref:Small ribosomal subunit protein mS78 (RPPR3a)-like n=1 Tax=Coffea arabica TaxID=13443 RepID=A0A6P6W8I7_COFAR|nr:pentatricopeptide repeat-containing protein At3g13160, mitochondrial-like [Coffea arabica]
MSFPFCLLRRVYSTAVANPSSASVKAISEDLFKERNLKRLVEKFKQHSNSDRFRTKIGVYENTVRRLASAKHYKWIEEILEYQKQFKIDLSKEGFSVRLMCLYGKSGMFEHAQKVFDAMPEWNCERTVRSVNALLGACVNSGKFDEIDGLFKELPEKLKVKPDTVSYNTVIKGLSEMGALDKSISMVDEMEKNGLKPDLITFNTILDALYSNSKFDDGEKMWSRMVSNNVVPDIRTYNARLTGLVSQGRIVEAVDLFGQLGIKEIKVDVFSYCALLNGYCKEGNLEEVKRWYRELVANECVPNKVVYWTVVSFACEKGDYDWAFQLCQDIFKRKCIVDIILLQRVVDGLVKESKIAKAKQVVQMGKSNGFKQYMLKLPSEE